MQPYYSFWGRLGGKVRWGESFEEAAKRDYKKEGGHNEWLTQDEFMAKEKTFEVPGSLSSSSTTMCLTIQESTLMTLPSTNTSRIDALMRVSDQIYPILEQKIDGEIRARQVVRLSMAATARSGRSSSRPMSHWKATKQHL